MWLWGTLLGIVAIVGVVGMLVERRRGSGDAAPNHDPRVPGRPSSQEISEVKGLEAPGNFGGMVGPG